MGMPLISGGLLTDIDYKLELRLPQPGFNGPVGKDYPPCLQLSGPGPLHPSPPHALPGPFLGVNEGSARRSYLKSNEGNQRVWLEFTLPRWVSIRHGTRLLRRGRAQSAVICMLPLTLKGVESDMLSSIYLRKQENARIWRSTFMKASRSAFTGAAIRELFTEPTSRSGFAPKRDLRLCRWTFRAVRTERDGVDKTP